MHSIIVDPADKRHLLIGMSSGGIFESHDEGAHWQPLNKGVAMDFYPPRGMTATNTNMDMIRIA